MIRSFSKLNILFTEIIFRQFCQTAPQIQRVGKAELSKLRKISGFSFSKCKEALLKFDYNVDDAHRWLKDESVKHGWSKMGKLSDREMSNGLIGCRISGNIAVMLEMNCETDFVARNVQFQSLLEKAVNTCVDNYSKFDVEQSRSNIGRLIDVNGAELGQLIPDDGVGSLNDAVAVTVGVVGENMRLKRAVCMAAPDEDHILACYTHLPWRRDPNNHGDIEFGKYAALIRCVPLFGSPVAEPEWRDSGVRIAQDVCQHIVGLRPKCLGKDIGEPVTDSAREEKTGETSLLLQPFLLDEEERVCDLVKRHGLAIRDFVRFECGEE